MLLGRSKEGEWANTQQMVSQAIMAMRRSGVSLSRCGDVLSFSSLILSGRGRGAKGRFAEKGIQIRQK